MRALIIATILTLAASVPSRADDARDAPRPVPLTRPEMKQLLEDMKARRPRIPLPELTDAERAELGERGSDYEGRLRALYLNPGDGQGRSAGGQGRSGGASFGSRRDPDPNMSLDYKFKTQLFWIVSRTNNCQYCLGHQESKLLNAGMTEDEIAALDSDWLVFTPAEQAAYAFARKLTYEPHQLNDADIDRLRPHFTDLQVLEITISIAINNSTNRWKEGVGVPQSSSGGGGIGRRTTEGGVEAPERRSEHHSYLTPTSAAFRDVVTKVAPVACDQSTGAPTRMTVCNRPLLEPRWEVEKALTACRTRSARLPVLAEAQAREVLAEDAPQGPLPQWVRLLANFPRDGKSRILSLWRADQTTGDLSPLLKAQVSWIVARQDRAWYATGEAQQRLKELGQSDDQVYQLDGDWSGFTPPERALFTVARKLAATPVVLTDNDVREALELTGPREVVQLVSYVTGRASFDRITEAAGLPVEP
jgi:AhpD family alkylhydroperoxidase